MDRDFVVVVLALVTCAPPVFLCGAWPRRQAAQAAGRGQERALWCALWLPFLPAALFLAILAGWALQEPSISDEVLRTPPIIAAAVFSFVAARALMRAIRALVSRAGIEPAATLGLLRPRIAIAPALTSALDAAGCRAVYEHELAHARHRDPARIWLAQIATDLLWPLPAAEARFRQWRHALEIARDEEARANGVDGADLASAVIIAARLRGERAVVAVAGIAGDGHALTERIHRLLQPLPPPPRHSSLARPLALLVAGALLLGAIGFLFGDGFVRALPGVELSHIPR